MLLGLGWMGSAGGQPLKVEVVHPSESTVNWHYVDRLTISWGDAEPLVIETDVEDGVSGLKRCEA